MKRFVPLLTIIATASIAGCSTASPLVSEAVAGGAIQLDRLRTRFGTSYFRMRNTSSEVIQYYHWFGQGDGPVPYCRCADQTIRACSKVIYTDGDDYYIHERPIESGKAVTFSAETRDAVALGVLLWLDGREQYVWSAIP
jgi:hypothetical protein